VQGEARRNTTWTYPHREWQAAGDAFIDSIFNSKHFMADFLPFAKRIAQRGMILSLAQTALRLTSPGVPDLYQGNEIWDFSLVDPDNRRPVDFELRAKLLAALDSRSPRDLWENRLDGGIKMQTVRSLLHCRREFPDLFYKGDYVSVTPTGQDADAVVAFLRRLDSMELLVVVPRRLAKEDAGLIPRDAQIPVRANRPRKNVLTGAILKQDGDSLTVEKLFAEWPIAVFLST
jgi:(1->4)-alpha-D-glucan 1-alpha-D-glucosylmutase